MLRPASATSSASPGTFYPDIEALYEKMAWPLNDDHKKRFWEAVRNKDDFGGWAISTSKQEQVVLKFMYDLAALQREIQSRAGGLQRSPAVVSILGHHVATDHADCATWLQDFKQVRLSTETEGDAPTVLCHLLVMERGSSDLSDVMSHGNFGGKNMHAVRGVAHSVAQCLKEMNAAGTMHGDVKNRNFVLLGLFKYAAIDLDAAATIDPTQAAAGGGGAPLAARASGRRLCAPSNEPGRRRRALRGDP